MCLISTLLVKWIAHSKRMNNNDTNYLNHRYVRIYTNPCTSLEVLALILGLSLNVGHTTLVLFTFPQNTKDQVNTILTEKV